MAGQPAACPPYLVMAASSGSRPQAARAVFQLAGRAAVLPVTLCRRRDCGTTSRAKCLCRRVTDLSDSRRSSDLSDRPQPWCPDCSGHIAPACGRSRSAPLLSVFQRRQSDSRRSCSRRNRPRLVSTGPAIRSYVVSNRVRIESEEQMGSGSLRIPPPQTTLRTELAWPHRTDTPRPKEDRVACPASARL